MLVPRTGRYGEKHFAHRVFVEVVGVEPIEQERLYARLRTRHQKRLRLSWFLKSADLLAGRKMQLRGYLLICSHATGGRRCRSWL
jgi:hypothetical protein